MFYSEAKNCLVDKHIVFLGDSRIRQLFYSFIKIINPQVKEEGNKVRWFILMFLFLSSIPNLPLNSSQNLKIIITKITQDVTLFAGLAIKKKKHKMAFWRRARLD